MNEPTLSRNGASDPSGKLDRRVEFLVSEEDDAAIITMATLARLSKSELVRREMLGICMASWACSSVVSKIASSNPRKIG